MQSNYRALRGQTSYFRLLVANLIGRFGDSLDLMTYSWLMYQLTNNASLIALVMVFNYLPTILLSPFAGVLADRVNKKRLMALCDLGRALLAGVTALLFMSGQLQFWMLYISTTLISTLEAFRVPAGGALTPMLLPKDLYGLGAGLNATMTNVVQLIGLGCAGVLIGGVGCAASLGLDAGFFVLSAVLVSLLRYHEDAAARRAENPSSYFADLKGGFGLLRKNSLLLWMLLGAMLVNFAIVPFNSFQSLYVGEWLHQGPQVLSLMGVSLTGAMAVGSFLGPKLYKHIRGKTLLVAGVCSFGLGYVCYAGATGLGAVPALLLTVLGCVIMGAGIGWVNVLCNARLMELVPKDMMGRVTSLVTAGCTCMVPLGALLCAGLGAVLALPVLYLLFAAILAAVAVGARFVRAYDAL